MCVGVVVCMDISHLSKGRRKICQASQGGFLCAVQSSLNLQQADEKRDNKISSHPYSPTSILLQYVFKF